MQVRQAAGDGVSEPAATHPIVGLDTQVAIQRALRRRQGARSEGQRRDKNRWGRNLEKGDWTEKHRTENTDKNQSPASLS